MLSMSILLSYSAGYADDDDLHTNLNCQCLQARGASGQVSNGESPEETVDS